MPLTSPPPVVLQAAAQLLESARSAGHPRLQRELLLEARFLVSEVLDAIDDTLNPPMEAIGTALRHAAKEGT